jgi:hypothetical protein
MAMLCAKCKKHKPGDASFSEKSGTKLGLISPQAQRP